MEKNLTISLPYNTPLFFFPPRVLLFEVFRKQVMNENANSRSLVMSLHYITSNTSTP